MIKGLDYGMGTDIWNVSKAKHVHFTKVRHAKQPAMGQSIITL